MTRLRLTPELERTARRCVWFKEPDAAITDSIHFIAHVLTYGTHEDVKALRCQVSDDDLKQAIDHAPAGVFDGRSWAYWNLVIFDRRQPPPLPARRLP